MMLLENQFDHLRKLWNVQSRRELTTVGRHIRPVYSVAFSPMGNLLAWGTGNGDVMLWDVLSNQELATLKKHPKSFYTVYSVAFSLDGKKLASGAEDDRKAFLFGVASRL